MANEWDADVELSADGARDLIEAQFPSLAPATLVLLGNGWDNTAFLVNDRYVFRFPRRQVAAALLENEARALLLIGTHLPLQVPAPEFIGKPDGGYPYPFCGYPYIAGVTACGVSWTDSQRAGTAASLARFLAALHGIAVEEASRVVLPGDTIARADLTKRVRLFREKLVALEPLPAGCSLQEILGRAEQLVATPAHPGPPCWVHGDLYVRHILVDNHRRPCGVIDWGDAHLGDPALDLCIAFGFLPASARADFRSAYGPIDEATWHRAQFRALYYGVVLIGYGRESGDNAIEAAGEYSLRSAMTD